MTPLLPGAGLESTATVRTRLTGPDRTIDAEVNAVPWIKNAADVNTCADAAVELLDAAADMVADDGVLVFAVCSLEPEEGPEQVESFLARRPDFRREPISRNEVFGMADLIGDGDLRTLPCHLGEQGGMDGFYAARLRRSG